MSKHVRGGNDIGYHLQRKESMHDYQHMQGRLAEHMGINGYIAAITLTK